MLWKRILLSWRPEEASASNGHVVPSEDAFEQKQVDVKATAPTPTGMNKTDTEATTQLDDRGWGTEFDQALLEGNNDLTIGMTSRQEIDESMFEEFLEQSAFDEQGEVPDSASSLQGETHG